MAEYKHYSNYFCGNKVSDYGIEHGYVDYRTLAKAFDAVLNNDIISKTTAIGYYWEQESGFIDNSEEIEKLENEIAELEEALDEIVDKESVRAETLDEQIEELKDKVRELEYEQDEYPEIYQYFIVSDGGASILKDYGEIVFYNEELNMYVWGVTHWGTSWDYVLTDIKICNYEDEAEEE